jgi:hypothetical protein
MNRPVALLVLACAASSAWSADKQQVYKWTDANGVVHFSDAPPPNDTKNVQSVRLVGGMTSAAPAGAPDDTPKDGVAASGTAAAAGATTADPAELCKQARANLELLQSKTPVGIVGADGKATAIDDSARDGQIANAKLAIAHYCK